MVPQSSSRTYASGDPEHLTSSHLLKGFTSLPQYQAKVHTRAFIPEAFGGLTQRSTPP